MFNKTKRIRCQTSNQTNNNQQHAICMFCLSHWTRPKKREMNERMALWKVTTNEISNILWLFFLLPFSVIVSIIVVLYAPLFFYVSNATTLHTRGQLLVTNSIWVTFLNISTHCAALASGRKFSSALRNIKTFDFSNKNLRTFFKWMCVFLW